MKFTTILNSSLLKKQKEKKDNLPLVAQDEFCLCLLLLWWLVGLGL